MNYHFACFLRSNSRRLTILGHRHACKCAWMHVNRNTKCPSSDISRPVDLCATMHGNMERFPHFAAPIIRVLSELSRCSAVRPLCYLTEPIRAPSCIQWQVKARDYLSKTCLEGNRPPRYFLSRYRRPHAKFLYHRRPNVAPSKYRNFKSILRRNLARAPHNAMLGIFKAACARKWTLVCV